MPIYEYACDDCEGVFELMRPVREASDPQPCPSCESDARRIISRDFHAYTMRKGMPRRIPDQGLYWSLKGQSTEPDRSSENKGTIVRQFKTEPSRSAATRTPESKPVEVTVRKRAANAAKTRGAVKGKPKTTRAKGSTD